MIKYKITPKLLDNGSAIFIINFEDTYDMSMTFLRYQEFYESPEFAGKSFTILDYMEWYCKSQKTKKGFSYTIDWCGFNLPESAFYNCVIPEGDYNKYDELMGNIIVECEDHLSINKRDKFYIIAALDGHVETLKHELAHGLFYCLPEYKIEIIELLNTLDGSQFKKFKSWLLNTGYSESVIVDEMQAYIISGDAKVFVSEDLEKLCISVFDKYIK